jgi:hypothetical protein
MTHGSNPARYAKPPARVEQGIAARDSGLVWSLGFLPFQFDDAEAFWSNNLYELQPRARRADQFSWWRRFLLTTMEPGGGSWSPSGAKEISRSLSVGVLS